MKTILTPVDFSPATQHVVDAAVKLASGGGAEIVLFHVIQPPMVTSDYGLAMENVQEILEISEKAATRQLSHLGDSLGQQGVLVRTEQISGAAVASINDMARKVDADYIVLGSHGHGSVYELLVGSTTHGVLKDAPCPVLVVPPKKEK